MLDDFTVVLGIDREHLAELLTVLPTWKRHKPSLFMRPWVVFWHKELADNEAYKAWNAIREAGAAYIYPVASSFNGTRREVMLAEFVHVSRKVETPYYLKLDTDLVATGDDDWLRTLPQREAVMTAARWGYTKPASMLEVLDNWSQTVPVLQNFLAPKREYYGEIAKSNRITSYWHLIHANFARMVSAMTGPKLPVPSQDTTMWYIAERMGLPINRVNPAGLGWKHIGRGGRKLELAVNEAMR